MNVTSRPPSAVGLIEDEAAPLRRITVDEYHRMIAAGIFDEGERIQLIDGLFVVMTPTVRPAPWWSSGSPAC